MPVLACLVLSTVNTSNSARSRRADDAIGSSVMWSHRVGGGRRCLQTAGRRTSDPIFRGTSLPQSARPRNTGARFSSAGTANSAADRLISPRTLTGSGAVGSPRRMQRRTTPKRWRPPRARRCAPRRMPGRGCGRPHRPDRSMNHGAAAPSRPAGAWRCGYRSVLRHLWLRFDMSRPPNFRLSPGRSPRVGHRSPEAARAATAATWTVTVPGRPGTVREAGPGPVAGTRTAVLS
jgi:hypothetical protein